MEATRMRRKTKTNQRSSKTSTATSAPLVVYLGQVPVLRQADHRELECLPSIITGFARDVQVVLPYHQ
jgi:hypothetical protein